MKRTAGMWLVLAALGGCMSPEQGPEMGGMGGNGGNGFTGCYGAGGVARTVPGVQGPWGQPVNMISPYASSSAAPTGEQVARAMIASSVPLDMVQGYNGMQGMPGGGLMQAGASAMPGAPSGVIRAGGNVTPGGTMPSAIIPTAAISPIGVPFAPGGAPQMPPTAGPCGIGPAGAVAAVGALTGPPGPVGPPGGPGCAPAKRTEVRFCDPAGMKIAWYAPSGGPNCGGFSSSNQLEVPGRYNFTQAAIYRLKLSEIPNRPGLELYPTLEVVPSNPKTDPFLAHSAVPVGFTEEDFEQVAAGNFVVKVIYLPDPQFSDAAVTGVNCVVSTRLEPGVDPICEAHRRGCILLVVRIGNIDLEAPNTPPMDAPNMYMQPPAGPPPCGPGPMAMGPYGPTGPGSPMAMGPYGPTGPGSPMGYNGPMMAATGPLAGPPPGMFRPGAMGPGVPMMGPNTPMVMGPNGPVPVGPNGQPMGVPGMLPAGASGMPAGMLPGQLPGATMPPVSKLPDRLPVQQAGFAGSPAAPPVPASIAAAATAAANPAPAPQAKPADKSKPPERRSVFTLHSSTDKPAPAAADAAKPAGDSKPAERRSLFSLHSSTDKTAPVAADAAKPAGDSKPAERRTLFSLHSNTDSAAPANSAKPASPANSTSPASSDSTTPATDSTAAPERRTLFNVLSGK